jgi:acyl transferase domain-containing protein/acyl carrier protein
VKTNIGHLEAAAGIAGVIKVLLSLQHKILPGNPHLQTPNKYLKLEGSPFYLHHKSAAWVTPDNKPRIAGVSSFGFGGSNAHIILEEYRPGKLRSFTGNDPAIIVLSAKNENRLKEQVQQLLDFVQHHKELNLYDIAYTLQTGREAMDERVALVVNSIEALLEALSSYLKGNTSHIVSGNTRKDKSSFLLEGGAGKAYIEHAIAHKEIKSLAQVWVKGVRIDWHLLYPNEQPQKISLPGYPFARERYWFDSFKRAADPVKAVASSLPQKENREGFWQSENILRAQNHLVGEEVKVQLLEGGIALVRMESKESKNMFTVKFLMSLQKTFLDLRNYKDLKVVVLTGYGNIFCMGGSGEELTALAANKFNFTDGDFLYRGLLEFEVPVICAMQGHAFGGGLVFGLYGDIVLMSEESTYTANFMKYGFTPGMGATYIMGEKLGNQLATEMMYTARLVKGEEIKRRGASIIVTKDVLKEALQVARELSTRSRLTLEVLKQKMARHTLALLATHIPEEVQMHERTMHTPEVAALIENHFRKASLQNQSLSEPVTVTVETSNNNKSVLLPPAMAKQKTLSGNSVNMEHAEKIALLTPAAIRVALPENGTAIKMPNRNVVTTGALAAPNMLKQEVTVRTVVTEADTAAVTDKLKEIFEEVLHIPVPDLDENATFLDLGLDSISGIELVQAINKSFGINLEAITLYDYHTLDKLAELVAQESGRVNAAPAPTPVQASVINGSKPVSIEKVTEVYSKQPFTEPKVIAAPEVPVQPLRQVTHTEEAVLSAIVEQLKVIFEDILHIPADELNEDATFLDFGLDSISGIELMQSINKHFNINLEAIVLYDYYTINMLAGLIAGETVNNGNPVSISKEQKEQVVPTFLSSNPASFSIPVESILSTVNTNVPTREIPVAVLPPASLPVASTNKDIAIIGMSGRFPDADNVMEFWENLKAGKDSVREVPERKWSVKEHFSKDKDAAGKSYGKWMAGLTDEDKFDALFFNISPLEAERMDPQQRLFLEESWKVIEDAGYAGRSFSGTNCGVFVGVCQGDYTYHFKQEEVDSYLVTGGSSSILAARISYHLNLQGPAISIDTACSSSLVAIHQACQSIRTGECETAIAGGVSLITTQQMHIMCSKANMLSESGRCRTFDNEADGITLGEAVGVVLLKSLEQAEKDGDHIIGVIKGSRINQDGRTNGIMAPSVESQTKLEREVYKMAGIDPSTISYVETHGTGTKLGDPIEIRALKESFKPYAGINYCGLGSVKTNIGHTVTAAGVTSVIKVLLAMKYGQLPPTINFNRLNEYINLDQSPFYINTKLTDWKTAANIPRRAAVSSFGFSGTNAHLLVEEYRPAVRPDFTSEHPAIILLSARNAGRLKAQALKLYEYIRVHPLESIYNIAYTLQCGREPMEERMAMEVNDTETLLSCLSAFLNEQPGDYITGNIKKHKSDPLLKKNASKLHISQLLQSANYMSLADAWVKGHDIDWNLLYPGAKPVRISLPTYPFARERHWINPAEEKKEVHSNDVLHPLLHFKATEQMHPLLHRQSQDQV